MIETVREKIKHILEVYDSYTEIVDEIDYTIDVANEELHKRYPNYLILRYTKYIYLTLMDGDLPLQQYPITELVIDNINNAAMIKYHLFDIIEKGLV